MEHQKNAVHKCLVGGGHIVDIIDCLIECGIGIDVGTETDSFRLKVVKHVFAGIILCPVECHMLQEVRKTELIFGFKSGTYFLGNIEISPFFRQFVVQNEILHSIWQRSVLHIGIEGKRLHLGSLCSGHKSGYKHQSSG